MKKPLLRKLLLASMLLLFRHQAATAADSGLLMISGTVELVNEISVVANEASSRGLDIEGGEHGRSVATVYETSNNASGYEVSLSSANGGELRLEGDRHQKASYRISYGGGSYVSPKVKGSVVKEVSSLPSLTTNSSEVLVEVTANPAAAAGVYSDVITLTIIANP